MEERLSALRDREVVNVATGERLGYVEDVLLELRSGRLLSLIVPGKAHLFSREEDLILPWSAIRTLGGDIILVDGERVVRSEHRTRPSPFSGNEK